MSLRVAHILPSAAPVPGSVAVGLPGLAAQLCGRNIESTISGAGTLPTADVYHVHGWNDEASRGAVGALVGARRRFVLSPLGGLCTRPNNPWSFGHRLRHALFHKRGTRGAGALLAVNQAEADQLLADSRHPNVVVLPCGADIAATPNKSTATSKRLLYLGSMHPRFGCVALLLAIAELGSIADGWTIDIAGSGDPQWSMKLKAAIRRKGADDRVRFVQADDAAAQQSLVATASAAAVPSLHFDAGVSVLQAANGGVPVVATDVAVPQGLEGVVTRCEPRREELRRALREVLSLSDAARTSAGQRLHEAARRTIDWSILAPRYAALYEEVARG